MEFKKATKEACKARIAIYGPSGAGKSFSSLRIANGMGKKIAVIDTEHNSASKYADRFEFDTLDLRKPTIDNVVAAFRAAEGYDVLILDSMTHSWQELLQEVEKLAQAKYKGNTWSAWSEGTPKQKQLINAILGFPGHVIATMRSKTEWTQETIGNGRSKPVRVGLAPEQGKSIEFEFDLLMSLTVDHIAHIEKDRSGKFQDAIIEKPGEEFGRELAEWLSDGAPPTPRQPEQEEAPPPKKSGARRSIEDVPEEHRTYCLEVEHEINHEINELEQLAVLASILKNKPKEVQDYIRPIYKAKNDVLKTAV